MVVWEGVEGTLLVASRGREREFTKSMHRGMIGVVVQREILRNEEHTSFDSSVIWLVGGQQLIVPTSTIVRADGSRHCDWRIISET